ncbi:MAG: cation diffusion facilitator family transporter [Elusimicrobiota bacterium]
MNEHHHHFNNPGKLLIAIVLNFIITGVEIVGGIVSGSLALISDAVHNFSDAGALILSYVALKLSSKENTEEKTFGYKRVQILVALFNATVLILVSFFLFKEAIKRFINPQDITSGVMIGVAFIGLAANSFSVWLLHKGKNQNLNIRAAYMHLFSDVLSSIAVILGGVAIYYFEVNWVDPLLTILIGLYVLKEGYKIVENSVSILLDFAPTDIDLKKLKNTIEKIDGVDNVHHVHVRSITENNIHFEAHIDTEDDIKLSESCNMKDSIEKILKEKFGIYHSTLQFEYESCSDTSFIKQQRKRN